MVSTNQVKLPLKWHGGKHYQAAQIIELMPPHLHYVEPYGGGLAVLFNKDPFDLRHQWGSVSHDCGISEVVNDVNHALQNFWAVLKDENAFRILERILALTPFSEDEFLSASQAVFPQKPLDVSAAAAFFIRCRQSRAANFRDFATLSRTRTRRSMNEQVSAWLSAIEGLPAVHERLQRVVILCRHAIDVIRQQDGKKTLFYLDPPYVHATRSSSNNYAYEMTDDDHRQLLDTIKNCKGAVMLSGYPNDLYDRNLSGWNRHDFRIDNKVSGSQTKRVMTERIWCNF